MCVHFLSGTCLIEVFYRKFHSHRRTIEGGENSGNLGFEEISDGELEEEARARGL